MENKTAVEFLEKEFDKFIEWDINGDPIFIVNDVNKIWDAFEQAFKLEKQQIIDTFETAFIEAYKLPLDRDFNTAGHYYSQTYKKPTE